MFASLSGPHQRLQPSRVLRRAQIDRVQVEAGAPRDLRNSRRKRNRAADRAGKHRRRDAVECRRVDPLRAVIIAVAVRDQAQTRRRADFEQGERRRESRQQRQQNAAPPGLVGLRRAREHQRADATVFPPHDLGETVFAFRDTAEVPDGRQKQIGLTLVRWQAGEKDQQFAGSGDRKGEPLIDLGFTAGFVDGKPEVALRYALQLVLHLRHSKCPSNHPRSRNNRRQWHALKSLVKWG